MPWSTRFIMAIRIIWRLKAIDRPFEQLSIGIFLPGSSIGTRRGSAKYFARMYSTASMKKPTVLAAGSKIGSPRSGSTISTIMHGPNRAGGRNCRLSVPSLRKARLSSSSTTWLRTSTRCRGSTRRSAVPLNRYSTSSSAAVSTCPARTSGAGDRPPRRIGWFVPSSSHSVFIDSFVLRPDFHVAHRVEPFVFRA